MDAALPSVSATPSFDSTAIFRSSLSSLSLQTQTSSSPSLLPPVPSDFPQSKLIPKSRFVVDGFRYAGDFSVSYFLTHFHSDHYSGLSRSWSKGVIFCSPITARLLVQVLNVPLPLVVPLPLSHPVWIDGCEITLIDANHCPGAAMLLFKIPRVDGEQKFERYVHTGDFRYRTAMESDPFLSCFVGADSVFLDTTYCHPKFVFPSQEDSVDYIVDVIGRTRGENCNSPRSVLFLIATYVIGKEKILLEVASRCDCKIHVDGRKMAVLDVLGHGESGPFTRDDSKSCVHVVGWNVLGETWPYFRPNIVKMKEIMVGKGYSRVVGFVPTGWTYEVKQTRPLVWTKDPFQVHLVPYSEHSNYNELRECVRFLRPKRVIPTVGMNSENLSSQQAEKIQKHLAGLFDEKTVKREFFMAFHRTPCADVSTYANREMEVLEKSDMGSVLSSSSSMGILHDSTLVNGKWTQELVDELQDCLPIWVTLKQLLDLLSRSDGNLVEAVSNFYEHEAEFHEQASAYTITSSGCELASFSKSATVKDRPIQTQGSVFKQDRRAANVRSSVKKLLPKKGQLLVNKPSKKAKVNLHKDSARSKQPTITNFFNKPRPDVSQGLVLRDASVECSKNVVRCSYKEELDQLTRIIAGNNYSTGYAASILEKAKGDVNAALNMHFTHLEGMVNENNKSSSASCRAVHPQCNANDLTSVQVNNV